MRPVFHTFLFALTLVVASSSFASNKSSSADQRPTLFTASWCDYCAKAKIYLGLKKITYREVNIETSEGSADFSRLDGKGVPFLRLGGREIYGFSEEKYDNFFRIEAVRP